VSLRVTACLLVVGWFTSTAAADWPGGWLAPSPLTTAQQIRHLTPEAARAERPVKLTGVVTHVNTHSDDFFLQDASAGIYVRPSTHAAKLAQGDRVELEGTTHEGEFAPCVTPLRVRVIEQGAPLPEPLPFNLSVEDSRWLHAQWVHAAVVVRGASADKGVTRIEVTTPRGRGTLIVSGEQWARAAQELKGAALTVRGVCARGFTWPPCRRSPGRPTCSTARTRRPA
jgi:hypothetical protein